MRSLQETIRFPGWILHWKRAPRHLRKPGAGTLARKLDCIRLPRGSPNPSVGAWAVLRAGTRSRGWPGMAGVHSMCFGFWGPEMMKKKGLAKTTCCFSWTKARSDGIVGPNPPERDKKPLPPAIVLRFLHAGGGRRRCACGKRAGAPSPIAAEARRKAEPRPGCASARKIWGCSI